VTNGVITEITQHTGMEDLRVVERGNAVNAGRNFWKPASEVRDVLPIFSYKENLPYTMFQ
jgi:hypothetical protein